MAGDKEEFRFPDEKAEAKEEKLEIALWSDDVEHVGCEQG